MNYQMIKVGTKSVRFAHNFHKKVNVYVRDDMKRMESFIFVRAISDEDLAVFRNLDKREQKVLLNRWERMNLKRK